MVNEIVNRETENHLNSKSDEILRMNFLIQDSGKNH